MNISNTRYHRILLLFLIFFGIAAGVYTLKLTLNHLANLSPFIPQIEKNLEEKLKADVKIGNIQWITWGGLGVEVKNLKVSSKDESLDFGKIVMIFRVLPLLKKQIVFDRIKVADTDIALISGSEKLHITKTLQAILRYLNSPIINSNGFSVGTAIKSLSISSVNCSLYKSPDKKTSLLFQVEDLGFEVSDYFKKADIRFIANFPDSRAEPSRIAIRETVENITARELFESIIDNAFSSVAIDAFLREKQHTFSFQADRLPLGEIARFFDATEGSFSGETFSGKITASGREELQYNGDLAFSDKNDKEIFAPRFSGTFNKSALSLDKCSFVYDEIPVVFGGRLGFGDPEKFILSLRSDEIELEKLAKNKKIISASPELGDFIRRVSKGKLSFSELKSYFPKVAPDEASYVTDPQGILSELRRNLIVAKGTIRDALLMAPSGEKHKLTKVGFKYDGSRLFLSEGRIEIRKNFVDIANVVYDPATEAAEGNLAFVLRSIPLKEIDKKTKGDNELSFTGQPAFPVKFKADLSQKSCSLSALMDQQEGEIVLKGGKGSLLYNGLKGNFNLIMKDDDLSFIVKVDQVGIMYGDTEIKELSFNFLKKKKFLGHRVKRLSGHVDLDDLLGLYGFIDPDSARGVKAKGKFMVDVTEIEDRDILSGKLDVENLLFSYVDEITEKPGTVSVQGNTSILLKNDLSDVIKVSFENIALKDSSDGEVTLKGKVWKSREKLFTDLRVKGSLDAGAMKVAYENIVGENFFLSTGFEGFYGITGKAVIDGVIKGNVTDKPENIDLKINLLDLALLDSDNGNLWDRITGDIHVTSQETTVGKFQYFVGENRYILTDSKISIGKEGRSFYHITGKGFIDLEKYRDDNKLFSRSLKSIDIRSMRGKAVFDFKVDEEKEKTFLALRYQFDDADFLFWKDIHKKAGERLQVSLKGHLLNDPDKIYFLAEECLIDYLEDKYLLAKSEFFDNNVFDIHLSTTNARLDNLLKLLDYRESENASIGGGFNGMIDINNFGNTISIKGVATLSSLFFKYGNNTFSTPSIEISCLEKACTSGPFLVKANSENVQINRSEITIEGSNFNRHWLTLNLYSDLLDFDRIFGKDFYQNWYKESITKRVTTASEGEFVPQEFSGNCLYCDHNRYDIDLMVGAININQQLFKDFKFHLSSQYGIVNLDNFSADFNGGSIFYQGRYNSFKEKPASFQGKMTNLDLNIINAFIPDLSFFSSGKGDLSFYFSSSVNSREIYDYAKGELNFDFKNGSIDLYKWFKKINYKTDKSDSDLQRLPGWKFSQINGNAVIFGDKINVKKLFIEGEDKNIAALGTFAIKPKEIDVQLAAYPLARMENIPLFGKLLAGIVRYYGISGDIQAVETREISPQELEKNTLDAFSSMINETRVP